MGVCRRMKTMLEKFLDARTERLNHSELVLFLEKELASFDQAVYLANAIEKYFDVKVKTNEI
jgi:hypothetical protein